MTLDVQMHEIMKLDSSLYVRACVCVWNGREWEILLLNPYCKIPHRRVTYLCCCYSISGGWNVYTRNFMDEIIFYETNQSVSKNIYKLNSASTI